MVGEVKTQFKRAIVGNYEHSLCLHREDSDPELLVVKQLREEYRREGELSGTPTAVSNPAKLAVGVS